MFRDYAKKLPRVLEYIPLFDLSFTRVFNVYVLLEVRALILFVRAGGLSSLHAESAGSSCTLPFYVRT